MTPTITSSTSGATICYTTDGSTPAATTPGTCSHGTTLTNGGSITISSAETVKAIGTLTSYLNSSVSSAVFNVYSDQTGTNYQFTDTLAAYYNSLASSTLQLPLDAWNTSGKWTNNANGSINSASQRITTDSIRGAGYYQFYGSSFATFTGATGWNTAGQGQYSEAYIHVGATGQVTVMGSTAGGVQSAYELTINQGSGTAGLYTITSGSTAYTFCSASSLTITEGETFELRWLNGYLQPLLGGSAIPGCAPTYADATYSTGNPGAGGIGVYNPTVGTINASSPLTPITWGGITSFPSVGPYPMTTSTDTSIGAYPSQAITGTWAMQQLSGSLYALGASGSSLPDTVMTQYRGPFRPGAIWAQVTIQEDTLNDTTYGIDPGGYPNAVQNYFIRMGNSGTPGGAGCYDTVGYTCGFEPCNRSPCTGTVEYANTPQMHCTKDTPATSSDQQIMIAGVLTWVGPSYGGCTAHANYNIANVMGAQSTYVGMRGDVLLMVFNSPYLDVYCMDGGRGHLVPSTVGNGCPSSTHLVRVIHSLENELNIAMASGQSAIEPGLWINGVNAPVFQYFSFGSVGTDPCTTTPGLCLDGTQNVIGTIGLDQ